MTTPAMTASEKPAITPSRKAMVSIGKIPNFAVYMAGHVSETCRGCCWQKDPPPLADVT
jgi:hypothetical protein